MVKDGWLADWLVAWLASWPKLYEEDRRRLGPTGYVHLPCNQQIIIS